MSETRHCPNCEAALPPDAPEGACPKCLLKAGFESADGGSAGATPELTAVAERFPELEIEAEIGRGGMGVVYKARQRNLDRLVALKVLPREVVEGDEGSIRFEERFSREARALARLSHPNIVGVHEFGEREGVYYFLMEFVDGVNLRQAMRAGDLTPVQALAIVPQICDALQYAHDQGVVHRDIKPENVLMDTSGKVQIADFGLAKLVSKTPDEHTLTKQGLVMGTPHYMAPEQFEKPSEVDHRADIYSLGVVLYEMLTGELPLGRFAPPSEKVRVDVRLDEVVLRSLEKDADRRYQAVSDVKTGIGSVGDGAKRGEKSSFTYEKNIEIGNKESKRSSMAVWSVLTPIAALVLSTLIVFVFSLLRSEGGGSWAIGAPITILGAVAGLCTLAGVVMAIVSMVRIQRSDGKLHGMGFAVIGLLLPLLCCAPGIGFTYFAALAPMEPPTIEDEFGPPRPIMDSEVRFPADRLERAGEVQIDIQVPAKARDGKRLRVDIRGRGFNGARIPIEEASVNTTSTVSWPLPSDHVLVVTRVTMTGDSGDDRPVVHVGEVDVPGPDASGTDPTWVGAVSVPAADEALVNVDVVGDGATYVVIEGYVLRPADLSVAGDRTTLLVDDRTVTLRNPERVHRMDLSGRFDGSPDDNEGNVLIIPPDHFFVVEKATLVEKPRFGSGTVSIGATRLSFDASSVEGKSIWAGRMEIHPGCESGVFTTSSQGAEMAVELFGRMYRVLEQK